MTATAWPHRPECGGPSVRSAIPLWRCLTADLRLGLTKAATAPADTLYHATYDPGVVCSLEEMRVLTTDQNPPEQIIDARSSGRFLGTEPEPRPGIRAGRMPGSLNVPSTGMIDTDTGLLLDTAALRDRFEAAGVDLTRPMVTSCGSGVTAAFLAFALHQIGAPDAAVYDGSWTEWGGLQDTPIDR
jgi:thiosulfate/3-mercaptopyruvate sulfurtransferase